MFGYSHVPTEKLTWRLRSARNAPWTAAAPTKWHPRQIEPRPVHAPFAAAPQAGHRVPLRDELTPHARLLPRYPPVNESTTKCRPALVRSSSRSTQSSDGPQDGVRPEAPPTAVMNSFRPRLSSNLPPVGSHRHACRQIHWPA